MQPRKRAYLTLYLTMKCQSINATMRPRTYVLPHAAARICVLGIPRRGWRGFESPAKFKLLTMEGFRCLGGCEMLDFVCSIGPGLG